MNADAWVTLITVVAILAGMYWRVASPAVLTLSGVVVLLLLGILDADSALTGFSNPAPFTVGALFVVARAISKTGAIRPFTQTLMGTTGTVRRPMLRLLFPTTIASGLMNNIPLVAMMIPEVGAWARKRKATVSQFLLPLSYGAILGGTLTLIGTSTNLVVAGQMEHLGLEPLGFFEIGVIGGPIAVIGIILVVWLAPRLLQRRSTSVAPGTERLRDFSIDMEVIPNGPLDGATVEGAGLRHLAGVFLASVDRGDSVVAPARPSTVLHGGDTLRFVGQVDQVLDLQEIKGMRHTEHDSIRDVSSPSASYFTVAIGHDSPLVGKTLKRADFRAQYQAAVVAIHRAGARLETKPGDVVLRPGDALVILTDPAFERRWRHRDDFLIISTLEGDVEPVAPGRWRTLTALFIMVIVAATGLLPILHAALATALAMIVMRVVTPDEARRALDLEVLGVIAAAFGLAAAVERSGLGTALADALVTAFSPIGELGVLLAVVVTTIALTELVTNNAAALLMLPIAMETANAAGVDPRGMAIAVAVSASASFLSPLGYQTNTMVYGAGGYDIRDFLRLGTPVTAAVVVLVVLLVPLFY